MERTVSPTGLKAMLAGAGPPVRPALLDVRRRPAFEADPRMISGAVWRDPHRVDAWAAELMPGAPVVVYCVHGHEVSNGVVDRLRDLGFDAALVEGGIEAWRAAGGAVAAQAEGGVP
jgi:thiosulfate sulfurtransferase